VLNVSPSVAFYRDILGMREVGRCGDFMAFFSATASAVVSVEPREL